MQVEKDRVYTFKLTNADEIVGKVVDITTDAYVKHSHWVPCPQKKAYS